MACFVLSGWIAWQGWRGIVVNDDNVPSIEGATTFLKSGIVPSYGVISGYNSLNPPGSAWLLLPGVLAFFEFRFFELPGSLLLHAGTLIGLFILVSLAFSRPAARLAVSLYALSSTGLFFASSLWPRGHPFFCVWFAIWIILWHARKDARYLAFAVVTLAAGMYVHMELAPLVLVVPAVWYLYRPPVRTKWVLVAASVSLLIWFPYLRFERGREFKDITSLVFQADILPQDSGRLICDRTLREEVLALKQPVPTEGVAIRARNFLGNRVGAVLVGLLANFPTAFETHLGSRAPLVLFLIMLVLGRFAPPWVFYGRPQEKADRQRLISACILLAVSAALFAAIFVLVPNAKNQILRPERRVGIAALLALLGGIYQGFRSRPVGEDRVSTDIENILVLTLVIPWLALLGVAEAGGERRYLFLWPLQAGMLGFLATDILVSWRVRASMVWAAQVALILAVAANPDLFARMKDWRTNGWAGTDPKILGALEFVANEVERENRNRAAIGYSIYDPAWAGSYDASYQAIDPQYMIGMGPDYVLRQRFGVQNSNHCPEGISAADGYRVFQHGLDLDPPEFVRLRGRSLQEFEQVARFGQFAVLRRRRAQDEK
jgi:hypothetical protein